MQQPCKIAERWWDPPFEAFRRQQDFCDHATVAAVYSFPLAAVCAVGPRHVEAAIALLGETISEVDEGALLLLCTGAGEGRTREEEDQGSTKERHG